MAMKLLSVVGAAMLVTSVVHGQQGAGRGGPVGIAQAFQNAYSNLKANVTQSAEVVPEAGYGLKPSTMAEVKTFGQVVGHVADAQFNQCSGALGMPNPNQGNSFEAAGRSRAEIIKGLAESFALCDKAFAALTDENASELIAGGRGGQQARAAALLGVIAHGNEMYGIYTVYQRAQNIVPPSTAARGRGRGGPGN
jgi:hypothetical protein